MQTNRRCLSDVTAKWTTIMKTHLYATAFAGALLLGTSGLAIAQGTPPVADPTAGSAETPAQQKGKEVKTVPSPEKQTTGTSTGGGQTTPPTPSPIK
jgi:hypothetical protein